MRQPERFLYIAGTMGLRDTSSAPKTLDEQLELIWKNIRTILAKANMTTDNIVRLHELSARSLIVAANGAARERALGSRRIPTTAIVVQTLDPAWLVEIEAMPWRDRLRSPHSTVTDFARLRG